VNPLPLKSFLLVTDLVTGQVASTFATFDTTSIAVAIKLISPLSLAIVTALTRCCNERCEQL